MKLIVWLAFHNLLGVQSIMPRSVSLDLEATMLLHPGDLQGSFVDKLRRILDFASRSSTNYRRSNGPITSFLAKILKFIEGYDGEQMNEVKKALSSVAVYLPKIPNKNIRLFIKNNIARWSKCEPLELKKNIIKFSNNDAVKYLANNFDKFYDDTDRTKLDSVLTMLKAQSELDVSIDDIFKNIFEICFFDKYKNLDADEIEEFDKEIFKLRAIVLNLKDETRALLNEMNETQSKYNGENEIVFNNNLTVQVRGATENNTVSAMENDDAYGADE